ncbi:MAG: hypothetical protein ACOYVD_15600 [Bacillota bacterium]
MRRIIILLALLFLVCIVVLIYINSTNTEEINWFIFTGDNFIPAGLSDRPQKFTIEYLKPTYWALLGVFLLIYLKIIWKLVISRWQTNTKVKGYKVKLKGYGRQ